jgi:hypothetical protein
MVTMFSALASSSWLRMVVRRELFVLRLGADFPVAARLGAPFFCLGAVSVDVLYNDAVLHRDCVSSPWGYYTFRIGARAILFKRLHLSAGVMTRS